MAKHDSADPTTKPLTKDQLALLRSKIPEIPEDYGGRFEGINPRRTVEFWLATGIHPIDLSLADEANLRVEGVYAKWDRAKNNRPMEVPLPPDVQPWAQDFVESLPRYSTNVWGALVRKIGVQVGLPFLSPRAMRHTAIKVALDKTGSISDAQRFAGATRPVTLGYTDSTHDKSGDEKILKGGA